MEGMNLMWYECEGGLIIERENLKDDRISLRSCKAISNQGGSNGAE